MFLKDKLKLVRTDLELTQDQMAAQLGLDEVSRRSRISEWESGKCEPNRIILLGFIDRN